MTLRTSILAAAILALLPAAASAQSLQRDAQQPTEAISPDPVRLARHCVRLIDSRAERGAGAMAETTDQTMQRLRRLHSAGASDREIVAAGESGVRRVGRLGAASADAIRSTTRRCVVALIAAGADRELIGRVLAVSDEALAGVRAAAERSQTAIRQAVRRAIG